MLTRQQCIESTIQKRYYYYPIIKIISIGFLLIISIITFISNLADEKTYNFCTSEMILCSVQLMCDIYHINVCYETQQRLKKLGHVRRDGTSKQLDCMNFLIESTKLSNLSFPKFLSFYCALAIIIPSFSCFQKHVGTSNPEQADYQDQNGRWQVNVPPQFQGYLVKELAICNITFEFCLVFVESVNIFCLSDYFETYDELYFYQFFVQKYEDIRETKKTAQYFSLFLVVLLNVKLGMLGYILTNEQNTSAFLIMISNLLFCCVWIIISLWICLKQNNCCYSHGYNSDCFAHHMILIDSLILSNPILTFLLLMTLIICLILNIIGAFQFQSEQDYQLLIIRPNFFLIYDCLAMQFVLLALLIIKYFWRCCKKKYINYYFFQQVENYFIIEKQEEILVIDQEKLEFHTQHIEINLLSQKICFLCSQRLYFNKFCKVVQFNCKCQNFYHQACLLNNQKHQHACPLCKKEIL